MISAWATNDSSSTPHSSRSSRPNSAWGFAACHIKG